MEAVAGAREGKTLLHKKKNPQTTTPQWRVERPVTEMNTRKKNVSLLERGSPNYKEAVEGRQPFNTLQKSLKTLAHWSGKHKNALA
eukprot:Gb_08490 [translate_table: standard]